MGRQRISTLGNVQHGAPFLAFSIILYHWLFSVQLGGIYNYFIFSISKR